jgi:hypothetical protein
MNTESTNRELQRVSELASEYRAKGFDVVIPRSSGDSPEFLRHFDYIPDLIAKSEKECLIVEVKSRQSSRDLGRLAAIADIVNAQPSWQFVLVLTNSREVDRFAEPPNAEKARKLLAKSVAIGTSDETHLEAAFLFAWAALEASLRLLPEERKSSRSSSTPWTLIRNAAMEGHIGREQARNLDRLFKIRNSLLHAGNEVPPGLSDVELVRHITEEIILTNGAGEV